MNEQEKSGAKIESEVLVEKVREIDLAKIENAETKATDKNNTSEILNERRQLSAPLSDDKARKFMGGRSRRSFLIGGAAAIAGVFGYSWLRKPENFWIFERGFRFNENLSQTTFEKTDLAPEFPPEPASSARQIKRARYF